MRLSPLPDGYKLQIFPRYKLTTPQGQVPLSPFMGEILAYLVGRSHMPVRMREIADILYAFHEDGGPMTYERVITVTLHRLRERLRAYGVVPLIESKGGQHTHKFIGFELCEPTIKADQPKKKRGRPKKIRPPVEAKPPRVKKPPIPKAPYTTHELRARKRAMTEPVKPPPRKPKKIVDRRPPPRELPPEYRAAQLAPWAFPERRYINEAAIEKRRTR